MQIGRALAALQAVKLGYLGRAKGNRVGAVPLAGGRGAIT